MMWRGSVLAVFALLASTAYCNTARHDSPGPFQGLKIVSRTEWGSLKARKNYPMVTPVDKVVVLDTTLDSPACATRSMCIQTMKYRQSVDMTPEMLPIYTDDIAHSFYIGGDGIYEGRGWTEKAVHTKPENRESAIAITFIGDYTNSPPSDEMLQNCLSLIQCGVESKFISADYQLFASRDSGKGPTGVFSPGAALYNAIRTWRRYDATAA